MKVTNELIGERIGKYRDRLHMTQRQLADKSGVGLSTIKNIESNQQGRTLSKIDDLLRIAEALDVSPVFLLTEVNDENYVACEQLGLSNATINRLSSLQERDDNTLSDAINMFFVDSEEIESDNMTSAEELLTLFREYVLCPERELIVKTMNAKHPAFALTRDEALQLRLINHLSEFKRKYNNSKGGKENETGSR